jgi:hypothetical protein
MTHSPIKSELESLHQEKKALITILKKAYAITRKLPRAREIGTGDILLDLIEQLTLEA